jgi:hypothetical protein
MPRERVQTLTGHFRFENDHSRDYATSVVSDYAYSEVLLSQNNPNWRKYMKQGINVGGPFTMRYIHIEQHPVYARTASWGPLGAYYEGPIVSTPKRSLGAQISALNWFSSPVDQAAFAAPSLYNEMKPTKPSFGLANAIYELKDVPRMLKDLLRNLKDQLSPSQWGSYYLAGQFGWVPLLEDIRNLVRQQRKLQDRLNWLKKHEGKPVRTRSRIRTTTHWTLDESLDRYYNDVSPGLDFYHYAGVPDNHNQISEKTDIWASARWLFVLPAGPRDVLWEARMYGKLLGLDVSPSMVWKAVPWSWLEDWFTNAGDVVSNIDSGVADRCVADLFYVMADRYREDKETRILRLNDGHGGEFTLTPTTTTRMGYKTRIRGNPFGIALDDDSLSPWQISILGALGLSRI